jgi:hypothetical protein
VPETSTRPAIAGGSALYQLLVYWSGGQGRHTSTSRYEGICCADGCSVEASASFRVASLGWETDGAALMVTKDAHTGSRDRLSSVTVLARDFRVLVVEPAAQSSR